MINHEISNYYHSCTFLCKMTKFFYISFKQKINLTDKSNNQKMTDFPKKGLVYVNMSLSERKKMYKKYNQLSSNRNVEMS